jgi:hypothetical protein
VTAELSLEAELRHELDAEALEAQGVALLLERRRALDDVNVMPASREEERRRKPRNPASGDENLHSRLPYHVGLEPTMRPAARWGCWRRSTSDTFENDVIDPYGPPAPVSFVSRRGARVFSWACGTRNDDHSVPARRGGEPCISKRAKRLSRRGPHTPHARFENYLTR